MSERVAKNVVDRTFAAARSGAVAWNVHAEWLVQGRVNTGRLVEAAGATMHEHPMLRAKPAPGLDEAWTIPDESPPPTVTCGTALDDGAVDELRGRLVSHRFDLNREPPVRFHVVRAPDDDHVLVVADHALVDGVGVGRTMVSLMAAYGSGRGAEVDTRWREAHALTAAFPPAGQVRRTMQVLRERAYPLGVRLAPELADECPGYGVAYHDLSAAAAQGLAAVPRGPSTANDVVVAAFGVAGMRWNRSRGTAPAPFSVGVPLNLRPARSWFEGVCNATVQWPVRVDDTSPAGVLAQVTEQLRAVRGGLYSTDVRAVLGHLADRTRLSVRERYALATTTVVSIVPGADVARANLPAGMATARLYGGPPAPPAMGMTFGVVPDAGAYRFSARYLRSRHAHQGTRGFLSSVEAAIVELVELLNAGRMAMSR